MTIEYIRTKIKYLKCFRDDESKMLLQYYKHLEQLLTKDKQ